MGARQAATGDDGAIAVIVAVLMISLIAAAALVVDLGAIYQARRALQNAADATALAAAIPLTPRATAPGSVSRARATAESYRNLNGADDAHFELTFDRTYAANDTVNVKLRRDDVPLFFAPVFGQRFATVSAASAAVVRSPRSYPRSIMPFGILAADVLNINEGDPMTLKVGSGDGTSGNYQMIQVGGGNSMQDIGAVVDQGGVAGEDDVTRWTQTGDPTPVVRDSVDPWMQTCSHSFSDIVGDPDPDTGLSRMKRAGASEPGGQCHRVFLCPVVGDSTWPSGTKEVHVVGYAYFFISGTNGKDEIYGRFFRPIESNPTGWGAAKGYGGVNYALIK